MVLLFINNAYAAGEAPQGGMMQLVFMLLIFFSIMYFMIIRPQSKKAKEHNEMLAALSKGDEIATTGGLLGKVANIGDNFIELKVSEGTLIKIQRHAVSSVLPKGSIKEMK